MAGYESSLNVGYVYVLHNEAMPDYIKIGMTTRTVESRAKELSNTGVPGKWKAHFDIFVPDCAKVEKSVHKDLDHSRDSSDREFFKVDLAEAVTAVKKRANQNISEYPGWPDPESVRSHIDQIELKRQICSISLTEDFLLIGSLREL